MSRDRSARATTRWAIATHGGAASQHEDSDGCLRAANAARAIVERGGEAMAAALEATRVLEDDERFNAGTGSNLRLDGQTLQMDAALMCDDGRFGAVACIERVKNPILVAARVIDTPHLMLVGDGATRFARRLGFDDHDVTTDGARRKHARAIDELVGRGDGHFAEDAREWASIAIDDVWNFDAPMPDALKGRALGAVDKSGCDTVGAVVRDAAGRFCATASTGGTVYMLRGRVGDSPLIGSGLFAGPAGGVAATGVGEAIARKLLAKTVYDWLAAGISANEAAHRGVALFPDAIDVGLLVVSSHDAAIAANRTMAQALVLADGDG
jgi:L-asparaginase/beta-aspartyl-peptidase (threonine type)